MDPKLAELKKTTYRAPRIAFNWDGDDGVRWIEWPVTRERFVKIILEQYAGTHIDTIQWSPGDGFSLFNHNTKLGLEWGEHDDSFSAGVWMGGENGRILRGHGDEMGILAEECPRLGFNFYVSIRMNDSHDHIYPAFWSRVKEQHPGWLIGKHNPDATAMDKWEECTGIDYAVPEAREFKLGIIREIVENYAIDGLQLDFSTFPPFFKQGGEEHGIPIMNDFVRQVRAMIHEAAVRRGHYIALNVVCVDELRDNPKIGLDVTTWVKEGLVDEVVGGRSYVRFYPLTNLIKMCHDHGVLVYGATNHEQPHRCDRAWATLHWETGADGLQLFNYYYDHERSRTTGDFVLYDYNKGDVKPFFNEIGSREKLRFLDKTYKAVSGIGYSHPWMIGGWPNVQAPIDLKPDAPVTLSINCYDDLAEAEKLGRLKEVRFKLLMNFPAPLDEFDVRVNGKPAGAVSMIRTGNTFKGVEWSQAAAGMVRGANEVRVTLVRRTPHVVGGGVWGTNPDLKITDAEIEVSYL